ncbi:xanthine dehydrogenase accessory protein XdhC [Methylobacterium sp. J-078]|uniref:xanthine dehydrogenase accessory protein XdhC n=1 Tax=Methylobacterium sp. J-078 TaxID=2836657 RepID=UPI001FBAED67|nr:xanthine dehydrogenase accessory protein XdhC [Methylobacterium sp. J-078]MCJ2043759.1 xanthine dehydrogenase accessory protein XdhC [Methylobacterium sp. J-078]
MKRDPAEALSEVLAAALAAGEPAALVTLSEARGSTPREAGAAMLVMPERVAGTIGGGTCEWAGIARARELLAAGEAEACLRMPLGPETGQCCGGHVTLAIHRADARTLAALRAREAESAAQAPLVMIYGAGHVGRALALALDPLPFRTRIVDERPEEIARVLGIRVLREVGSARAAAETAPPGAAHVVLTHSHALDSLICAGLLEAGTFAYLGLIGSATKRATFLSAFREMGLDEAVLARLVCPIGGRQIGGRQLRDKRPAIIAALVAAELIAVFAG